MIGSLLIFTSILMFSWNYLAKMRNEVFSDMKILMMGIIEKDDNSINNNPAIQNNEEHFVEDSGSRQIDYSRYLGVLEIPKIGLKRGFYGTDSRYNNIRYNVTLLDGSNLPDVSQGNLILMAHSGDSYISYFAYLYKLSVGDECFVTYNGVRYHYVIVDIYDVNKIGVVTIRRDRSKTCLTMITCTKDNDYLQTVYIAEMVG